MKVTLLQLNIEWNNPEVNIEKAERLFSQNPNSDLYVLPEMWSTGFMTEPEGKLQRQDEDKAFMWMQNMSKKYQSAIAGSLAICSDDGKYRNRFFFVTPTHIYYYDKHHLFTYGHEDLFYECGNNRTIAEWKGVKFLLLTCYDLRFPVWSRYGIAGEYDAIIYVANWPQKRQTAWEVLTRARAIENQCYVIAVNRVGKAPSGDYMGGSCVIDPKGEYVLSDKKNAEDSLEGILSMKQLSDYRLHFPVLADRDVLSE